VSHARIALVALITFAAAACGDATGSSSRAAPVTVRFALVDGGASASAGVSGAAAAIATGPLVLTGTNGTLTIDEIAMIVSRIEFEQEDEACGKHENRHDDEGEVDVEEREDDEDCEEFEMDPVFLRLPLPGGGVVVATDEVPEGTWTELKFRVKNVDFDDDEDRGDEDEDKEENTELQSLLATVRAAYPDWPRKATLAVKGSFLPTGAATASNFTTFFDGEIKVKMSLDPPLVISSTVASREVIVELDPARWFKLFDGRVLNLLAFDFGQTHRLLGFRVEMKEGFVRVRMKR